MALALIIETGAIVAGANSYATIAEADARMAALGREAWLDVEDKGIALYQALIQMEARYRSAWKGTKRNDNDAVAYQSLSWPRKEVKDEDGIELDKLLIPQLVKDAQMEIAWLISQGSEFVQNEISTEESRIKSETTGPLKTEYFENQAVQSSFPLIDQMLLPLTGGTSAVSLGGVISITTEEQKLIDGQSSNDRILNLEV